jgi:hypothetical protein
MWRARPVSTIGPGWTALTTIADADRLTLVLYHAEPGSRSAQGLALLLASTISARGVAAPANREA